VLLDLLLRGGEVIDPGGGQRGRLDVGVRDGRVAAVAPGLDGAREVVDCAGRLVVPGLVDLHTHVLHDLTYWGIEPDRFAPAGGSTTWVDAGSAGGYAIGGLRRFVAAPSQVRVLAFLNVSSIGLVARSWELANEHYLDEELCARMAAEHAGFVVGVKARIDRDTVGGLGIEPLRAAVRVAARAGLPVMAHVAQGPPRLAEVLEQLRPGDVLTHCATAASMGPLDESGNVRPELLAAASRGVLLDIGHGSGSFGFSAAEALVREGLPLIVSSDAHQLSVQGPMYDLPTCLTKLHMLGVPLDSLIEASTVRPARAIGREDLGTLRVGSAADVTVLRREEGSFEVGDVTGEVRRADCRFVAEATWVAGRRLERGPLPPPAAWAR
jgi:dihydroorotase